MTDAAIIAASYAAEKSYTHNLDNVIDASDAVGAWGTTKESTTKLVDLSGNNNIADIHGAMPAEGFIQGRRYSGADLLGGDYVNCGEILPLNDFTISTLFNTDNIDFDKSVIGYTGTSNDNALLLYPSTEYGSASHEIRLFAGEEVIVGSDIRNTGIRLIHITRKENIYSVFIDGILDCSGTSSIPLDRNFTIGAITYTDRYFKDVIFNNLIYQTAHQNDKIKSFFNTLARLPFWSINYTDYPDNVTEYTDNLPYSSSIISSGTFKVDDDKLQCVSAGTMTYSASYDFDGSEYIKVGIDGVVYAGTGTITHGNTTVSVAQGSNKITITMGTGDTIGRKIDIQFRKEV